MYFVGIKMVSIFLFTCRTFYFQPPAPSLFRFFFLAFSTPLLPLFLLCLPCFPSCLCLLPAFPSPVFCSAPPLTDNSDSDLELSMVRHQPEGLDQLQAQTQFTRKELQSLYRGFKNVRQRASQSGVVSQTHRLPWVVAVVFF